MRSVLFSQSQVLLCICNTYHLQKGSGQRKCSTIPTIVFADEVRPENKLISSYRCISRRDQTREQTRKSDHCIWRQGQDILRKTYPGIRRQGEAKRTDRTRLTVASVDEVRPDDHLLRKAEDAESSTLQFKVVHVPGVSDEFRFLEKQHPASWTQRDCYSEHGIRLRETAPCVANTTWLSFRTWNTP